MKTDPQRYFAVLSLAPRLAPVVPDAGAALRNRRVQSGVRAYFAMREYDWMTDPRGGRPGKLSRRMN